MRTPLPETYAPRLPPYAHQREALELGWRRRYFAYLMDMGTGKSKTLVDNACLLAEEDDAWGLLIVAPKNVYLNWTRIDPEDPGELAKHVWERHLADLRTYVWRGQGTIRERTEFGRILETQSPGLRVMVINAEALAYGDRAMAACRRFMERHRTLMVVDESPLMKNRKANRTQNLEKLAEYAAYRRILTGTVTTRSPTDAFSQFEFLEPGCLGHRSYFTFRSRYCLLREMRVGMRTIRTEYGSQNLEELAGRIARHSFRARKDECLDLPPKIYAPRDVELTDEQWRAYEEMRRSAMATFADGATCTTSIVMTQLEKLHQIACGHIRLDTGEVRRLSSNRPRDLLQLVRDTDCQTIVWCHYRPDQAEVARILREAYGDDSVAEWIGDVRLSDREEGERRFQSGRARFMLASQQSGSRGRNWTAAELVVYYSNSHSLEDRLQSEDRPHRSGLRHPVTYVDLIARGTVEERIVRTLRSHREVSAAIMAESPSAWI